jgi:hypothetical protein
MKHRKTNRIGVIADTQTHGLFDPAVRRSFQDAGHILHAGDIGSAMYLSG